MHIIGRSLIAAALTALAAACTQDAPLSPDARDVPDAPRPSIAAELGVNLGGCDSLRVPAGNRLSVHAFARGVQVYQWNGASWVFVEPQAVLYGDPWGIVRIGTHYAGPTWRGLLGSTVVGAVQKRCTPTPDAIPWLLLGAVSSTGPGVFDETTFVQRVNTTGGLAPSTPGGAVGAEARVPYTAEYFFYRAR
jgi:hypothetical protein